MMNRSVFLGLAFIGLLLAACGGGSSNGSYISLTLDDAEFDELIVGFADFPVYWVGEEFGGHELRTVLRVSREGTVSFLYGECDFGGGIDPGGCSLPLVITTEQYCRTDLPVGWRGRPTGLEKLRGNAEALRADGGLRLWTGGVTMRIYSSDPDDIVAALVSINGLGVTDVNSPLPAPDPDCSVFEWAQSRATDVGD